MKTIFLDRDGVINEDLGYVSSWNNFKFIHGSIEALQKLTKFNFNLIIVTNQSGIARGYYSEDDFKKLQEKFLNFCLNNNINILDIFYCPHHKDGIINPYVKDCINRKPNSGMFFRASKRHKINLSKAYMVGDKITDIIASSNAGIKNNFLVNTTIKEKMIDLNFNFEIKKNLLEVTKHILY